MRARTFAAFIAVLLLALPAVAQEQRGAIEGVVKDTSGAVLPGATVQGRSKAGAGAETVSDASGVFRFPSLAPGIYDISATLAGLSPAKVPDVPVGLGQIKKVDLALAVGGITDLSIPAPR